MTFTASIARTILRNLICGAFLVGAFLGTQAIAGDGFMDYAPHTTPATPANSTAANTLVADNDCWTGEAPADMQGVIPGRVVVTVAGETRIAGERMVGKALEQAFDGTDHGLHVHGFCR